MKPIDISGKRFGAWTVMGFDEVVRGNYMWKCRCDCGTEKSIVKQNLTRGLTRSCGCLKAGFQKINATTHGFSGTLTYRTWSGMWTRCTNRNEKAYKYYGGRGIKVCERWKEFENFLEDMGPKPGRGWSIERKNTHGDYEPGNCKWMKSRFQAWNTRNNIKHTIGNETRCIAEWCEKLNLPYRVIIDRIEKGATFDEAISKPIRRLMGRDECAPSEYNLKKTGASAVKYPATTR